MEIEITVTMLAYVLASWKMFELALYGFDQTHDNLKERFAND